MVRLAALAKKFVKGKETIAIFDQRDPGLIVWAGILEARRHNADDGVVLGVGIGGDGDSTSQDFLI